MSTTIIWIIVTVIVTIAFNALYVGAEFATVATRRTRISQQAAEGDRKAQRLLLILEDSKALDRYVAACQLGITISSLVLGAYGQSTIAVELTPILARWFENGETTASSIASIGVLIFITTLQVIMGELLPKSYAVQNPEYVALLVLWPMEITQKLLKYLIKFFNGSGGLILRMMGRDPSHKHGSLHSPEEIELLMAESHESGLLDDTERQMLRNAFRLRDMVAKQVMIHRTKVISAPNTATIEELINIAIEAGFSRIPIYKDGIDEIIGFVHVKDLFRVHVSGKTDIEPILREVVYVPETLPVSEVWELLNSRLKYMVIVFDEYGGTAGIITFEDLIEEIFGELQDEFDDEMAVIARDKEGRIYLRGDLLIADVNEYLELQLPEETADTLGGLIFSELGRPPEQGDQVQIGATSIQVEVMEDLSVAEVSLQLAKTDDDLSSLGEWEVAEHE